jgi:hypothetical protein
MALESVERTMPASSFQPVISNDKWQTRVVDAEAACQLIF